MKPDEFRKMSPEDRRKRIRRLSVRQLQTLHYLAEGHTTDEIASAMGVGKKTVESHRAWIKHKLETPRLAFQIKMYLAWFCFSPEDYAVDAENKR